MFFDKSNLSVHILDVIELKQENVNILNSNRNFNALSFRYSANTVFQTEEEDYLLTDHAVCFVPSQVTYRRISNNDHLIVVHFHILNGSFNKIEHFKTCEAALYHDLFRKILNCWRRKETGYEYNCTSLFYQILSLCHQENYSPNEKSNPIQASIDYMEAHFSDSHITISDIAKKSFISEVYFRKLFKNQFGLSPAKYIINLKMESAANLIQTGYYSLYEVARLVGYEDYAYFSSEFKRIKGISPSAFQYTFHS